MRYLTRVVTAVLILAPLGMAQTVDELVAKNIEAKGGIEKIKAIKSTRTVGKLQQGSFSAQLSVDAKEPGQVRQSFTIQGMTQTVAYDGSTGWQISPFQGRRDPELLGEDDLRGVVEDADFYGPLVDYEKKGSTISYLGHDTVDGDDALRLKLTLRNGDILYYYLDPDTYLEIRTEKVQFIRGAVRETFSEFGSYKKVNGVYFPFSIESGSKDFPGRAKITIERIEANVPMEANEFKWPAGTVGKSK